MRFFLAIALLTAFATSVSAITPPKQTPQLPVLRRVVRDSAMIFSGTVLRVEHLSPDPTSAPATTRITFRVQNAIRGVRQGQVVQVREWAGLWNSGERYEPGERVFLFLYPTSRLGLTSPVGGVAGRYQMDGVGRVALNAPDGNRTPAIKVRSFTAAVRRAARE